jgi:tRNA1(Val) A37 N6-methylase TrmN6
VARQAQEGLFALWARSLARCLRHRGTISFIVHAGVVSECLAAFTEAGCGSHAILPLWPRAGREAKLVLLQAVRGGRGPTRILPGLVLHAEDAPYTEAASRVLRGGHALLWGDSE